MAVDYRSPVGQVRLLISDVDESNLTLDTPQIEGLLGLNDGNVRRAAADALDTIASSEVLVSKVIKTQDLSTDGAKVADSLRAHAQRLRDQADEQDDRDVFDIVYPPSDASPELTQRAGYSLSSQVWGL